VEADDDDEEEGDEEEGGVRATGETLLEFTEDDEDDDDEEEDEEDPRLRDEMGTSAAAPASVGVFSSFPAIPLAVVASAPTDAAAGSFPCRALSKEAFMGDKLDKITSQNDLKTQKDIRE